jgi:hypothetical protein
VIVVKGQHDLIPAKQFDFVHRLDPAADRVHGFDTEDVTDETSGVLGVCSLPSLAMSNSWIGRANHCLSSFSRDSTSSLGPPA